MVEATIFEISSPGRIGVKYPESDVPSFELPAELERRHLPLPEVAELDVVRHFTRLSKLNYSIDSGFYPLGSCTMKYNPRINEVTARLSGFAKTHPLQPVDTVQGNLALMYELQEWLAEISGFSAITLQPAAGAQGEYTGVLIIRAYHKDRGDTKRTKMIIPDSAHGTNPASSSMSGFDVVHCATNEHGNIDLDSLRAVCDDTTAGLMLTNPNTLGLFEQGISEVIEIVHQAGGLVYGDGANLNALLGITRPGDLGIDIMHFNLHKTFSTPHGGGGPGSGPVGVASHLVDFLPCPVVGILEPASGDFPPFYGFVEPAKSIGRMKAFYGHFGMVIRAYTYISMYGKHGLREIAEGAVLNANYLMALVNKHYKVAYPRICMHEFVVEGHWPNAPEVIALDVSKRLMDYNFHPPTNYFPLIVPEALMIEPTETENKETLELFADALIKISDEAVNNPQLLKDAPHNTPIGRLDEVKAAKDLVLCCWIPEKEN
ncbi:MAG: glycine dehydrogenase (aminomethyl-transferring) [Chloroflexi bacterium 44-23]|nr:MAG: glycine dehydrogenase (aminomethyl-transferring) [Chloroflexi bacterium 44-23]